MDILAILEDHLDLIERFYDEAGEKFETTLRKIEAGEEPFVPQRAPEDYDGPEYEIQWTEADQFLGVIGSSSLQLLEKVLHDYLREFVEREGGAGPKERGKSWFEHLCRFLEEKTSFRWTNSPVSRGQIEEINLSRNDFAHDPMLGSTWPFQSEKHFREYPVSTFADKLHLAAVMEERDKPEVPIALKVTRENLTAHIEYVRQFCTFVEAQRTWNYAH
jgi:hypothetical protein